MMQENELDQLLWETWKDAKQAKIGVRTLHFYEPSLPEIAARETLRFVSQVRRRLHRGSYGAQQPRQRSNASTPKA
jgi:hypothetical protein